MRPFVLVVLLLLALVVMVNGLATWDRARHEARIARAAAAFQPGLALLGYRDTDERRFQKARLAVIRVDVPPDKAQRIPAVRHVDGTARIQTINRAQHPLYYDLVAAFRARTGVPVLVNTSFNTRGEPIVCSPRDAIECFWTSPLDALVIGSFLLEKPERCA